MRHVPFELPYRLSGLYCSGALNQIAADQMNDQFPAELLSRIYDGSGLFGSGCDLTQEDLNGLNDTAWNYLKSKLA